METPFWPSDCLRFDWQLAKEITPLPTVPQSATGTATDNDGLTATFTRTVTIGLNKTVYRAAAATSASVSGAAWVVHSREADGRNASKCHGKWPDLLLDVGLREGHAYVQFEGIRRI